MIDNYNLWKQNTKKDKLMIDNSNRSISLILEV